MEARAGGGVGRDLRGMPDGCAVPDATVTAAAADDDDPAADPDAVGACVEGVGAELTPPPKRAFRCAMLRGTPDVASLDEGGEVDAVAIMCGVGAAAATLVDDVTYEEDVE